MRYLVLFTCLLAALATGFAQENQTLSLSKSVMSIKISHPEQQLTTFAPLLTMLQGLAQQPVPAGKNAEAAVADIDDLLKSMVDSYKNLPGIDVQGDLWLAIMPPPIGKDIPPFLEENGVVKPNPESLPAAYLLLPLADAKAFKAYIDAGNQTKLHYTICGKYAVGNSTTVPSFTNVQVDLPLITTRGIAISMQVANINMSKVEESVPPIIEPMLTPVLDVMEETQQNIARYEVGLTMLNRDLSVETSLIPVDGSPLAKSIATAKPDALAGEYAGYLPENLAYCGASGPMLNGAPGSARTILRVAFGILGAFMPNGNRSLNQNLDTLMNQCSQGRVIGITAPEDPKAGATVVAVYHTDSPAEAKKAMRGFVSELTRTRDNVMGGMLSNVIGFDLKANAANIEGISVDLLKIAITPPDAPATEKTKAGTTVPTPMSLIPSSLECYVAYLDNKMLFTMGYNSKAEMGSLIKRVRHQQTTGFATGDRYTALKQVVPEKAYGFESIGLRDMSLVVSSWLPAGEQRDKARFFLSMFPPQTAPITTYQEILDGRLHGEIRIPAGQFDFLYAVAKAAQQMQPNKTNRE